MKFRYNLFLYVSLWEVSGDLGNSVRCNKPSPEPVMTSYNKNPWRHMVLLGHSHQKGGTMGVNVIISIEASLYMVTSSNMLQLCRYISNYSAIVIWQPIFRERALVWDAPFRFSIRYVPPINTAMLDWQVPYNWSLDNTSDVWKLHIWRGPVVVWSVFGNKINVDARYTTYGVYWCMWIQNRICVLTESLESRVQNWIVL